MKNQSFSLKIDKPCSVNLSSMSKNDVGLFCTNCEKSVIDFSKLSDEEVIAIVEKMNGNFCGRFTKNQLDRVFVASRKKPTSPRLNKILAGLFALGMLETAHVEAKETKNAEMVWSETNHHNNISENNFEKNNSSGDTTKNTIRGTIMDGNSQSLVRSGKITILGTSYSTQIDTAGKFSLSVPDSLMNDSISLLVVAYGYETKSVTIKKVELPFERIILLQEEMIIEGGVTEVIRPVPCDNIKKKKKKN